MFNGKIENFLKIILKDNLMSSIHTGLSEFLTIILSLLIIIHTDLQDVH